MKSEERDVLLRALSLFAETLKKNVQRRSLNKDRSLDDVMDSRARSLALDLADRIRRDVPL